MDEPEILDPQPRADERRTLMHVLYAMHTIAWLSFGVLAVIAVLVNHIRRSDESDPLYGAHHRYMIRTFWWTLGWLLITAPLYLLFILPGVLAQGVVGLWYLYRCLRGWLRFVDRRMP
jgi:uncharacterized membrane protein